MDRYGQIIYNPTINIELDKYNTNRNRLDET